MYTLTDSQIDFILNDIRARGVEMEDLQYNLLDHICCIIERELEANGDFDSFYYRTVKKFYKHELWEIEEETISLQIFKHYYTMKKIMIGSGIVSAFLTVMGILFKFMHWPGAGALLVLGITSSSLVFLPLLFTLKLKEKKETKGKLIIAVGTLSGILFSMGILFKVMHWPMANMMGLTSVLIMVGIFLPIYFISGIRNPDTKVNTIVTSILIVMGAGLFFTLVNTRPSIRVQNTIAFSSQRMESAYSFLTAQNTKHMELATKDSLKRQDYQRLNELCNSICLSIDSMKIEVVSATEGVNVKKIDCTALQRPENFDVPTSRFFDNKGLPRPAIKKLKNMLSNLNKLAAEKFGVNASGLIDLNDRPSVHEEGNEPWENSNFYHVTEDMVLKNFIQLQLDVRIVEGQCLNSQ